MFNTTRSIYSYIAILIVALIAVVALTGCGSDPTVDNAGTPGAPESITQPVAVPEKTLDGTWESTDQNLEFVATIAGETITINWTADNTSALYWKGTVPPTVTDNLVFVSEADVAANDASLLGSGAEEKTFVYDGGSLSFGFEIMGVTQNVFLERK